MDLNHPEGTLAHALELQPGDVIAFVGAGGKTSLMLSLADELFNAGSKVMVTTTTKIGITEQPKNSNVILGNNPIELLEEAKLAHGQGLIPVLASKLNEAHERLLGLKTTIVDELASNGIFDFILIEADGARRKAFKIPKPHEPVVPECVTKLCIVVGLDALGKPISDEHVYNLKGIVELGAKVGEPLTPALIHRLLFHTNGFIKYNTGARKLYLILNKYDEPTGLKNLQEISNELYHNSLDKIILTSTITSPTVKEIPDNHEQTISGVILAAGKSTRFNGLKQNADIGGCTLLGHVTNRVLASNLDDVVLVLGYQNEEIKKGLGVIAENKRLTIVENIDYEHGLSTSLKTGLKILEPRSDAVMFILGDQPNISANLINEMIMEYKNSNARLCLPIIQDSHSTRPGNPVIIGSKLYPELYMITGDIGARDVVKNHMPHAKLIKLEDESSQLQINTQEDLLKYRGDIK